MKSVLAECSCAMKLTSTRLRLTPSTRVYHGPACLPVRFIARDYHRLTPNLTNVPLRPYRVMLSHFSKDLLAGSLFARRRGSSQAPTSDPSRPDLFYHLVSVPHPVDPSVFTPAYAVSFLSTPPPSSKSATIIGWLPAIAQEVSAGDVEAGLNDFVENGTRNLLVSSRGR